MFAVGVRNSLQDCVRHGSDRLSPIHELREIQSSDSEGACGCRCKLILHHHHSVLQRGRATELISQGVAGTLSLQQPNPNHDRGLPTFLDLSLDVHGEFLQLLLIS